MDKQQQIRESLPGDKIELYQIMKAAYDNSFVINDRTGQKMLAENAVPALTAIAACDYFEPKLAAKDATIKELTSQLEAATENYGDALVKIEKLTGLLEMYFKEAIEERYHDSKAALDEQWEYFKEQHNITP